MAINVPGYAGYTACYGHYAIVRKGQHALSISLSLSGLTSVPTMGDTFAKATRKTA